MLTANQYNTKYINPTTTENVSERFWSNVDLLDGDVTEQDCWLWKGRTENEQPIFSFGHIKSAKRVVYMLYKGNLDSGKQILRTCSSKYCVNPSHLIQASNSEKWKLMKAREKAFTPSYTGFTVMDGYMLSEAIALRMSGESYQRIGVVLNVSASTVINHLKMAGFNTLRAPS